MMNTLTAACLMVATMATTTTTQLSASASTSTKASTSARSSDYFTCYDIGYTLGLEYAEKPEGDSKECQEGFVEGDWDGYYQRTPACDNDRSDWCDCYLNYGYGWGEDYLKDPKGDSKDCQEGWTDGH